MKHHFIFPYFGNKREEVETIYENIKHVLDTVEVIVEPYSGSSSFSYYISSLFPGRFKYILNDNNNHLTDLYLIMKNENEFNNLISEMNALTNNITKSQYLEYIQENNNYKGYFLKSFYYSIRPGLFPTDNRFKENCFNRCLNSPILNFLRYENVQICNNDALSLIQSYLPQDNTFLFIDPPYLSVYNGFYNEPNVNIYEFIYNNPNEFLESKSRVCFCLEKTWIIDLLFKSFPSIEYHKSYRVTGGRKTIHKLIVNFQINS
jgi:site-specific DNA-adenine methylase